MGPLADLLGRPVLEVAPALLGWRLTHGGVTLRLTEVEAYAGSSDPGSHAYRGRTPRTEVMFGRAGHLYVYFTYGMHHCVNVVTGVEGEASAVLLRAGEVVGGHDVAEDRRPGVRARDLARGPARLTRTLGIDLDQNGLDLLGPPAGVGLDPPPHGEARPAVRTGPRVGVRGPGGDGVAFPWRFWLEGEATVSPYRPASRPARRSTVHP